MDLSNENVIHQKKDGIEFLQFRRLLEYEDIISHMYSLGLDCNYDIDLLKKQIAEDKYQKARKDYQRLCEVIGEKEDNLVKMNQTHSDHIVRVDKKILKEGPDIDLLIYRHTDGMMTNQSDLLLSTTNADCILLLLFDPVKKVIANVHSGWRGTLQRIAVKAVKKMKEEYNSSPKDIICCICPSIRQCHFEVDIDVKELFEKEFRYLDNGKMIEKKENQKWNVDTVWINQKLLKKEGLQEKNIIDSGICSVCHSDLIHSYRVEKENYKLETALIGLK